MALGHELPEPALSYFRTTQDIMPTWHSIYWQGLPIWAEIYLATEGCLLLTSWAKKRPLTQVRHANPFHRYVIAATIIFTFFNSLWSWNIIFGVVAPKKNENFYSIFFAAIVSSGGVSLLILLGGILDKIWKSYGFWCVYVLNYQNGISETLIKNFQIPIRQLSIQNQELVILAMLSIFSISIFLVTFHQKSHKNDGISILVFSILPIFATSWLYKLGEWFWWLLIKMHVYEQSAGQPFILSNAQIFYVVSEFVFILFVGGALILQRESRPVRLLYVSLMIVRLLLIYFLERSRIKLGILYGPDIIVAGFAVQKIHEKWSEFRSVENLKAMLKPPRSGSV